VAHTRHHIMDSSRRGISPNVHRRITAVSRILALSAGIWACFAFFFFFCTRRTLRRNIVGKPHENKLARHVHNPITLSIRK
jgi:hypothetical protein